VQSNTLQGSVIRFVEAIGLEHNFAGISELRIVTREYRRRRMPRLFAGAPREPALQDQRRADRADGEICERSERYPFATCASVQTLSPSLALSWHHSATKDSYMLRSLKDMEGYSLGAIDGPIGQVRDFYFDDESWVIRYLVVETDAWYSNKRVLISPLSLGRPNWSQKVLPASITQSQVRGSPDIDTDKPVSRQHEMGYLGYYGYGNYWGGSGLWGGALYPDMLQGGVNLPGDANTKTMQPSGSKRKVGTSRYTVRHQDPHLRSVNAVMRYYVHASDGDIGHVQGILVDERSWAIHYVIVDTSNWWLGHQVLIAPEWIDDIDWAESKLVVDLTRRSVKDAPRYDPKAPLTLEQEKILHGYYGHTGYWPAGSSASSTH
jgi:hypothetical protein